MKNYEEYKTWLSPFYILPISINIILALRRIESENIYERRSDFQISAKKCQLLASFKLPRLLMKVCYQSIFQLLYLSLV